MDPQLIEDYYPIIKYIIGPAVVTLMTVSAPFLYRYLGELKSAHAKKKIDSSVKDVGTIYDIMHETLNKIPIINRIVIVSGKPSPTNPSNLTIIHEVATPNTPLIRDIVQNMPVDEFHREEIIIPLLAKGSVIIDRNTANGYLKDVYEAYNHTFSKGVFLTADDGSMTYAVFSFSEGTFDTLEPIIRETLRGQINKLCSVYKKY